MLLPTDVRPFRLTLEDYGLLAEAGAFAGRRVELIEGVIVEVNAETRQHVLVKNRLSHRLQAALEAIGAGMEAVVEPTLALPPHNMPEPDVMIVRTDAADLYFGLADVVMVVEVGVSTLASDLGLKMRMYAEQGLPEYWVVDVARREVHQFWTPAGSDYADTRLVALDGELRSATVAELAIDGAGIV